MKLKNLIIIIYFTQLKKIWRIDLTSQVCVAPNKHYKNMGRTCSVSRCSNEQKTKVSLFQAPKSTERRAKWSKLLDSSLTERSYVCEKHFHPSSIKKAEIVNDGAGNVLYEYQFKKKVLMPEAMPLEYIFVEEPYTRQKSNVDDSDCYEVPSDRVETNEIKVSPAFEETENLYEKIKEQGILIKLPKLGWGMHCCPSEESIIFSEVKMMPNPWNRSKNDMVDVPVYIKQVILKDNLELLVLCLGRVMKLQCTKRKPQNVKDIEDFIEQVDGLKVCLGGPSVKYYKNLLHLKNVYRDHSTWRHRNCPIIQTSTGSVCGYCISLEKILSQKFHLQRKLESRIRILEKPTKKFMKIKHLSKLEELSLQQNFKRKQKQFDKNSEVRKC